MNLSAIQAEELAEKLHEWYLEGTRSLDPENYNPKAQKSYAELNEEQKEIDRYIANKIQDLITQTAEATQKQILDIVKQEKEVWLEITRDEENGAWAINVVSACDSIIKYIEKANSLIKSDED